MGLESPGVDKYTDTQQNYAFSLYLSSYVWKNETVTTKSLNSNDYFNLSSIVMHRNSRVALQNKWVWGTQWGLIYRYPAKLCLFTLSILVCLKKWNCYNEKFEL